MPSLIRYWIPCRNAESSIWSVAHQPALFFIQSIEESKSFNISESNGNSFSGGETPTILGDGDGSQVTYLGASEDMPPGLNIPIIPLPMLQAGVGLIKGTELDFRYVPELDIGSAGKVGLFGVGLKHDILQWLPIVDKIPIDLSIQAGYTKLSSEIELIAPNPAIPSPQANLDVSATTVNLILSKKLLMFTPYLGVGYNSTKTTFNVKGDYNIAGLAIDMSDLTKIDFENKGFSLFCGKFDTYSVNKISGIIIKTAEDLKLIKIVELVVKI